MPHTEKDPANLAMIRRMVRHAGYRVGERDPELLAELYRLHDDVNRAMVVAIHDQRSQGITWESIGQALGVTKQAALMRWGAEDDR